MVIVIIVHDQNPASKKYQNTNHRDSGSLITVAIIVAIILLYFVYRFYIVYRARQYMIKEVVSGNIKGEYVALI